MKTRRFKGIPVQSTIYVIGACVIVVLFVLVLLYPSHRSLSTLDREISNIQSRIDIQKNILPIYPELVKKSEAVVPDKFSLPEPKKIPKNNIDLILSIFRGVARKTGMELTVINPDFTTISREVGEIMINATARGGFFNFRDFLIEMGRVPYVRRIEEIEIQQRAVDKEFKMKIWLSVA